MYHSPQQPIMYRLDESDLLRISVFNWAVLFWQDQLSAVEKVHQHLF